MQNYAVLSKSYATLIGSTWKLADEQTNRNSSLETTAICLTTDLIVVYYYRVRVKGN